MNIFINRLRVILNDIVVGLVVVLAIPTLLLILLMGQCSGETWPAAFGIFEQNGPPFGDESLHFGLAIPCVYIPGFGEEKSHCQGMILKQNEDGAFLYDESMTWPAPCTPAAAFVLPVFNATTGHIKIPVLMFGGKLFWVELDGFTILDWGQYEQ